MQKSIFGIFGLLIAISGSAQDVVPSSNSVFFGYSRRSVEGGQQLPAQEIANGWGFSFDHMLHSHIGLTADFAGQYGRVLGPMSCATFISYGVCSNELHNFASHQSLFGPRFTMTGGRMTAFAGPLAGFSRLSGRVPQTNFIMGFGGGLDIALTRRIAIRAFQADYIPEKTGNITFDNEYVPLNWRQNVRLESGIVFRFGRK